MATHALDIVTILKCIKEAEDKFLGEGRKWGTKDEKQTLIFKWYAKYKNVLNKIIGLDAKASEDARELNDFLKSKGFAPMFHELTSNDIGVASILDKLVKWLQGTAQLVDIVAENRQTYPGFELPKEGTRIFETSRGLLAELKTRSNDTLWLLLPSRGIALEGLEMVKMAFELMSQEHAPARYYAGAKIPMLDFEVKPNINFMNGVDTYDQQGAYWFIAQAFQAFKMRMDEEGARVKVATGMRLFTASIPVKVKLVFNRPFYGWWTQDGLEELPIAVFCVDYDSWRKPAGRLEDL